MLERDGSCSVPMETSDRPDLSLLRPLWSLYTSMLEKEGGRYTQRLFNFLINHLFVPIL